MDAQMTIEQAAGQILTVGFEGTELPDDLASALQHGRVGGVILFRRNIESLEQVVALNAQIASLAEPCAPWICIDQEGGPVRRLREEDGVSAIPAMRVLGERDDEELTAQVGEIVGRELAALGFNVDFAPVVDVDTVEGSFIGARAFGTSAQRVARHGVAFARGLANANVVACAKHFPGHGGTQADSHLELPVIDAPIAQLEQVDLVPFKALIEAGIPMVMTAHIIVRDLDAEQPATLSSTILEGWLRQRMGYRGLVVSDDLEMAAVADHYTLEELLLRGLAAGVDIFLICRRHTLWQQAWELLVRRSATDTSTRERVMHAAQRVVTAKRRLQLQRFVPSAWRDQIALAEFSEVLARCV